RHAGRRYSPVPSSKALEAFATAATIEHVTPSPDLVGRPGDIAPVSEHRADPRASRRLPGPDQGQPWKSVANVSGGFRPHSLHQFCFGRVSRATIVHFAFAADCRDFVAIRERPLTLVTPSSFHGKEGVDGSSPSEGSGGISRAFG